MSRHSDAAEASSAERGPFIGRLQAILQHWPSADRLARATGVSPSAFRKWLRGEAEPNRERLIALGQAAGVNVGWLVSGDGPNRGSVRPLVRPAPSRSMPDSTEAITCCCPGVPRPRRPVRNPRRRQPPQWNLWRYAMSGSVRYSPSNRTAC